MGNGINFGRRPSSSPGEGCNPQDEAMSFRGKCSAMKTILHTDGSKIACMKYFRGTDAEVYMNYYFEVEDIKTCTGQVFVQKVLALRQSYDPQCITQTDVKLDIWQNIESVIADEDKVTENRIGEIVSSLKFSQSYVISVLANYLDDFLASSYYNDWEKERQTAERENVKRSAILSKSKEAPVSEPAKFNLEVESRYRDVLLADDSAVTTKITSAMLTKAGFRVTKASHGRDVINLLTSEQSFGLALIDLYMPIVDGFQAVETFKNSVKKGKSDDERDLASSKSLTIGTFSVNDEVCIIGMSSDENLATRNRAYAAGVDYFLQKPFTMEKFMDILRDIQCGVPSINRAPSGVK